MLSMTFILCCVFLFSSFVFVQNFLWKRKGEKKTERNKKKRKKEKQSPSRGPEPFQGPATPRPSSADDRAPPLSLSMSLTPRAHLSARTVLLPHVSDRDSFSSNAEPIPKTPGSPCYLVHQAPIKAQGPPRDFPLQFSASRDPYPSRSSRFWISASTAGAAARSLASPALPEPFLTTKRA
jgi:hypothetical protein